MMFPGRPRDEGPDHLVAHELVDDGVVLDEDVCRDVMETVNELANGGRADALGQRGRATHVREQDGAFDLSIPRAVAFEALEAAGAVVKAFGP